jgi:hypothetical protein
MEIADFTGSEAEELRRAMGFKRPTGEWKRSSEPACRYEPQQDRRKNAGHHSQMRQGFANTAFPNRTPSALPCSPMPRRILWCITGGVHDGDVQ